MQQGRCQAHKPDIVGARGHVRVGGGNTARAKVCVGENRKQWGRGGRGVEGEGCACVLRASAGAKCPNRLTLSAVLGACLVLAFARRMVVGWVDKSSVSSENRGGQFVKKKIDKKKSHFIFWS